MVVLRVQQMKFDSESFVNVYRIIRYLSVAFKKNSSVKEVINRFYISKWFGRSILFEGDKNMGIDEMNKETKYL